LRSKFEIESAPSEHLICSALLAKRLKTAEDAPETISEAVSRRDYTFFNEKSKTGFVGLSNQGKSKHLLKKQCIIH
jgi:hypothetical protein